MDLEMPELQFRVAEKLSDFRELHSENPSKFDRTFACLVRDMVDILKPVAGFDEAAFKLKCYGRTPEGT